MEILYILAQAPYLIMPSAKFLYNIIVRNDLQLNELFSSKAHALQVWGSGFDTCYILTQKKNNVQMNNQSSDITVDYITHWLLSTHWALSTACSIHQSCLFKCVHKKNLNLHIKDPGVFQFISDSGTQKYVYTLQPISYIPTFSYDSIISFPLWERIGT